MRRVGRGRTHGCQPFVDAVTALGEPWADELLEDFLENGNFDAKENRAAVDRAWAFLERITKQK